MSIVLSFCLYFTSYAPLWISIVFIDILSIVKSNQNITTEIISLAIILTVTIISAIVIPVHMFKLNDDTREEFTLITAQEQKSITIEYLLSYILPLIAFNFTEWDKVVLFLLFYSVIGVLFIRHKYFTANIVLDLLGFNFYNCTLQNIDNIKITKTVISKEPLTTFIGTEIVLKDLNNEYRIKVK